MNTIQRQSQFIQNRLNQIGLAFKLEANEKEIKLFKNSTVQVQQPSLTQSHIQPTQINIQPQIHTQPQFNFVAPENKNSKQVNIRDLDQFNYNQSQPRTEKLVTKQQTKKSLQEPRKADSIIMDNEFGYCLNRDLFEELLERLKLVRKTILKKENSQLTEKEIDNIIPTSQLMLMAKFLPENIDDMDSNKGLDALKTIILIEKFFSEVRYFIKKKGIDKNKIYEPLELPLQQQQTEDDLDMDQIFSLIEMEQSIVKSQKVQRECGDIFDHIQLMRSKCKDQKRAIPEKQVL